MNIRSVHLARALLELSLGLFSMATLSAVRSTAQQRASIPIRQVTTIASSDSGVIDNVYMVHVRRDGGVLLNDGTRHRLVLFDPMLRSYAIVADTSGQSPVNFGAAPGGLLPFRGDSTAFIDRPSQALVVVDAKGKFGRTLAPPKVADMQYFAGSTYGVPGFDNAGRLYYRGVLRPQTLGANVRDDSAYAQPDSAPIIRADFEARRLDTVALMRIPARRVIYHTVTVGESSIRYVTDFVNPLPFTDEWAYFPDGTIAVVRGQDYHIDWFLSDGTRRSTPKMPFDWRRLTETDKVRMVDSVQRALDSAYDAAAVRVAEQNRAAGRSGSRLVPQSPRAQIVPVSELPDYYPPIRASSQMRVDLDGNLWIMPTTSLAAKGGTLFDVVNRNGEIIERVQLPEGRNLQGFGPNGIVYMSVPVQYAWPRFEYGRIERGATTR